MLLINWFIFNSMQKLERNTNLFFARRCILKYIVLLTLIAFPANLNPYENGTIINWKFKCSQIFFYEDESGVNYEYLFNISSPHYLINSFVPMLIVCGILCALFSAKFSLLSNVSSPDDTFSRTNYSIMRLTTLLFVMPLITILSITRGVEGATSFSVQSKLHAADGVGGDYFGIAVTIFESNAFIGAMYDDDLGFDAGILIT